MALAHREKRNFQSGLWLGDLHLVTNPLWASGFLICQLRRLERGPQVHTGL